MQITNSLSQDHRGCSSSYFLGLQQNQDPQKVWGLRETRACLLSHGASQRAPTTLLCLAGGGGGGRTPATLRRPAEPLQETEIAKPMFFPSTCIFSLHVANAPEGCRCLASQVKGAERERDIRPISGKATPNLPSSISEAGISWLRTNSGGLSGSWSWRLGSPTEHP